MKNRYILILSIIIAGLGPHLSAQIVDHDYSNIDHWAKTQKLKDTALVELTDRLLEPTKNDYEVIRAIYSFVIHFLDYEHSAYALEKRRINQNIYDIIERKKGICLDYAQLLCKMAEIAAIECHVVTGFSKDLRNPNRVNPEPDHAWNAVMIDSNYFLLDPTWASNTIYSKDLFQDTYQVDYFLTDPTLFINNHFPNLAMWQLLDCPLDFQEFVQSNRDIAIGEACFINFRDSIFAFNQMSLFDQKIKEQASVYRYLSNNLNQSAWAHALLDKAVDLKEAADQYYLENRLKLATDEYENALNVFDLAANNTTLYRWQIEARGFCHLNYAQVLYKQGKDQITVKKVIDEMKKAQEYLLALNTSSTMVNQALQQIEKNLQQLK